MRIKNRRSALAALLLLTLGLLLSACGDTTTAPAAPAGVASTAATGATSGTGTTGAAKWTGTITMFAQDYTPNAQVARDPKSSLKAFQEVADEYQKNHPGIKIQFVDEKFQQYDDTVRAKAAAGELWDIFWGQYSSLNNTLPQGIAVDLAPFFKQKNSYAPESATWAEAMNPTIINETASPGGASYNINGDYVATAFFYNKDMFTKAGITQPPKTWQELLDVSQKLKAAGMNAYVGVPYWGWMNRHFLSDFYGKDYAALSGVDKQPGFSALDEAASVYKGTLSPKDPRFMAWWPVFKQFTDFWVKDYITQPPDNQDTAQRDFEAGKAAMFYSGSWLPNQLRDNKVTFQYGSFNFPTLGSAVSQYSSGQDVSNAVGGPSGAYQFAMSTPRSDKTMNEAGKSDAVLDWMRYIGTPKVAEKIINESGSFIPTWNGAKPKEGTELLVNQANQKLQVIRVDNTSAKLDDDIQGIFGLYLSGNINLEQATQQMQQTLDRATQDYATKNKVDLSTYKS